MPTFDAYPASQVRAPDVWGAMQRGAEGAQINQMRQMEMEQMQADRQKQGTEDQRAKALEQMSQVADLLTPFADPGVPGLQKAQMWPQMLQRAQQMGLPIDKAPKQYDPQWVAMTMAQAGKYQAAAKAGVAKAPKIETFYTAGGGSQKKAWNAEAGEWESVGGIKPPSGMSIKVNEDGSFEFIQGAGAGRGGTSKKTQATIESKLMGYANSLARMDEIRKNYKRKFLEWGTKIDAKILMWKDKAGMTLTPAQKKFVTEISSFSRDAIENINNYIKEITGAQMSEKEADRIRLAVPDPGEGIFGGDSPIQFEAKLESAYRSAKRAQARYTYWLRNGVDMADMTKAQLERFTQKSTLNGIVTIMKDREKEIIAEVRQSNPDISRESLMKILTQTLSSEFGIGG